MATSPAATPPVPSPAQAIILEEPANEGRVSPLSVWSWALYDFANTIFSLNIVTDYRSQTADNPKGRLALHAGRQERPPPARAPHPRPRRPLHRARDQGRPRQPARRRLPRHRLDQGEAAQRRGAHPRSCRACTTSSRSWPASTSPPSRWKSARRRTTSWAASRSTPTPRCRRCPGLFAAGECAAGINGANRLGGNSLSDLLVFGKRAGEYAAAFAKANSAPRVDDGRSPRPSTQALAPFERGTRREPVHVQQDLQGMMQDLVGIVRTRGRDAARRSSELAR